MSTPSGSNVSLADWLEVWFERHLTIEELAGRTDDEWSALLVSDLAEAGFDVRQKDREQPQ